MKINGINVWSLDIETHNWTEIVLFNLTDGKTTYKGRSREDLVKYYKLIPAGDLIISHNGGRFDFLPLLDGLNAKWECTTANGIINMRAKGYALLIDTYRLFVLSLDQWTGSKTTLPFICQCGFSCGGYCAINNDMSAEDLEILDTYCFNDCIILLEHYKKHLEKLNTDGFSVFNKKGYPRSTIGSVAYNTAKIWCELPDGVMERTDYKLTKSSYYGGNSNAFSRQCDRLDGYDINSAYPAEQMKELPVGDWRSVNAHEALQCYMQNKAGLYYVKAYQDPCNMAILPRRDGATGRVIWATGEIRGLYVLREAQLAEQECRHFAIEGALIWDRTAAIYKRYIETCYELRDKYKKAGDNYEHVIKILMNSLYGKLAQNCKQSTLYKFDCVDDTPECENLPPNIEWDPIHGTNYWVKTVTGIVPESAKPYQAAYITGNVRVNIFNFAKPVIDHVAYIDTDCIYTRKPITENLGSALGEFKHEGVFYNWRCIGPKVYNYSKEVNGVLQETHKAKGVPFLRQDKKNYSEFVAATNNQTFDAFLSGTTIINQRGVNGLITSLRRTGGAFTRRALERTNRQSPEILGTRFVTSDETSVPLHFEEGRYSWPGRVEKVENFLPWLQKIT